ncbi:MAG: ABC transporter substrate-binding protein [Thermodesulfobacteriota bacterium]
MDPKGGWCKWLTAGVLAGVFFVFGWPMNGGLGAGERVRVGLLPLTSSAPIFIGVEEGLFAQEGVELELKFLQAAQPIAAALAAGEIDVGATGLTAGLYNAMAAGLDAKIVADKGREWPGYRLSAIVVSKAAWERGIREVRDLKGVRVGVTQLGSTFHYMLGNILEKHGLSQSEVKLVPLGGLQALAEALGSDRLEAVFMAQPLCTEAEAKGTGRILLWAGDEIKYQIAAIFMSGKFMAKRDLAKAFMRGYIKACRIYHDQCLGKDPQGRPLRGPGFQRVTQQIAKYTGLPPDRIEAHLSYNDRDGELMWEDIPRQIAWYRSQSMLTKELDPRAVVERALWEDAMRELRR